jgi:uncharacterized small protein (DUF1192 family)
VTGCEQIQQAIAITTSHIAQEQLDLSSKQAQITQIDQQLASLGCDDIDTRIERLMQEIQRLSEMIAVKGGELAQWQAILAERCQ